MIHTVAPVIVFIDVDSGISEAELLRWSNAQNRQLLEQFAPKWNVIATTRVQTPNEMLQPGEWPFFQHGFPSKTDPDGALAYHDRLDDGTPVGHNFAKLAAQFGDAPSSSNGHEVLEALADELLNEATQDADGVFWAREVCDPCEEVPIVIDGVPLSDFVWPEWFSPPRRRDPGAVYNQLGTIDAPWKVLRGGYAQKYDPRLGWQQVGEMRPMKAYLASLGLGRTTRRSQVLAA